jgi:hypothetical protein
MVLLVTEGEDKPTKYPHMFRACRVMLTNKIDLLRHARYDPKRRIAYARGSIPKSTCYKSRLKPVTAWTRGTAGCAKSSPTGKSCRVRPTPNQYTKPYEQHSRP